jgi:uncharacterized protein (TIGR03067 family)
MKRLVAVVALLSVFLLTGTYPFPPARGQDKPAPKPAWEWKAVALGPEEKEATKKLNELAAGGWEYVGPLAHGLVAFKKLTRSAYDIELEKFEGAWTWEGYTATWKGDKHEVYEGDTLHGKGVFKIDPAKQPKTFDYIPSEGAHKGDVLLGIYELDGDTLRICHVAASTKKPRPTEFSTDGKGGDVNQVWKRKK